MDRVFLKSLLDDADKPIVDCSSNLSHFIVLLMQECPIIWDNVMFIYFEERPEEIRVLEGMVVTIYGQSSLIELLQDKHLEVLKSMTIKRY